jgi:ribonuclease HI
MRLASRFKEQGEVGRGAHWVPPDRDVINVNADGAFNPVTNEAAIGVIARDHMRQPQVMAWRVISRCRDAEELEAIALLEGAKLAVQWAANIRVEIKTDCAKVGTTR